MKGWTKTACATKYPNFSSFSSVKLSGKPDQLKLVVWVIVVWVLTIFLEFTVFLRKAVQEC